MPTSTSGDMLTTQQLADLLGMSTDTLRTWRCQRKGPAYIRLAHNTVRYLRSDVEAWIDRSRQGAPS